MGSWLEVFRSDPLVGLIGLRANVSHQIKDNPPKPFRDAVVADVPVIHTQTYGEGKLVETVYDQHRAQRMS